MSHSGIHHNYVVYYDDPYNQFFDTTLVLTKGHTSLAMQVAERALAVAEAINCPAASASRQHAKHYLQLMRALDEKPIYWKHMPTYYDNKPHAALDIDKRMNAYTIWWRDLTWGEIRATILHKLEFGRGYKYNDIIGQLVTAGDKHLRLWLDIMITEGYLEKTETRWGSVTKHDYRKTPIAEEQYPHQKSELY